MKKILWTLSALAFVGIGFSACEELELPPNGDPEEYRPVDNEKYCDGECGKEGTETASDPYCFTNDITSTDVKDTFCSSCTVNCGLKYKNDFPNCVQADANLGGGFACAATATCPPNQGLRVDANNKEIAKCETLTLNTCKKDTDCSGDQKCNLKTNVCEDGGTEQEGYTYVRIDDLMGACTDADGNSKLKDGKCPLDDPGADIDAIVLVKKDGTVKYAADIVGYKRSDMVTSYKTIKDIKSLELGVSDYGALDPTAALEKPDGFDTYGKDYDGTCSYYKGTPKNGAPRTYVSLGGEGGYLEVQMGGEIEAGDTLDVLEIGECMLKNTASGNSAKAKADKVKVSVSISAEDGSWKLIGDATPNSTNKGVLSFNITADKLK